MNPQSNITAMDAQNGKAPFQTEDPFQTSDYSLAMIAAPFAAAGKTNDQALRCAQSLLCSALSDRWLNEDASRKETILAMGARTIGLLAKDMKLTKRSVWKHVTAVLGKREAARKRADARINPDAKIFPWEASSRIIAHQKSSIQKRNKKAAQSARRPGLKKTAQ